MHSLLAQFFIIIIIIIIIFKWILIYSYHENEVQ